MDSTNNSSLRDSIGSICLQDLIDLDLGGDPQIVPVPVNEWLDNTVPSTPVQAFQTLDNVTVVDFNNTYVVNESWNQFTETHYAIQPAAVTEGTEVSASPVCSLPDDTVDTDVPVCRDELVEHSNDDLLAVEEPHVAINSDAVDSSGNTRRKRSVSQNPDADRGDEPKKKRNRRILSEEQRIQEQERQRGIRLKKKQYQREADRVPELECENQRLRTRTTELEIRETSHLLQIDYLKIENSRNEQAQKSQQEQIRYYRSILAGLCLQDPFMGSPGPL